jgi:hypothetical protein
MKKLILIATTVAALSGLSAFGQGNFVFSSGARFTWNNVTGPTAVAGGAYNIAFLWATGTPTPLVDTVSGSVGIPTNNITGGGVQGSQHQASAADWNAILTDPNYQLARDAGLGSALAVGTLTATGGWVYNLASPFGVTGTATSGGTVNVFVIAWSNAYATPALAAAAGSSLGWSRPFAYTYGDTATSPAGLGAQAAGLGVDAHFGVSPVPEPATFTLAGLGAAALLIFRRRK